MRARMRPGEILATQSGRRRRRRASSRRLGDSVRPMTEGGSVTVVLQCHKNAATLVSKGTIVRTGSGNKQTCSGVETITFGWDEVLGREPQLALCLSRLATNLDFFRSTAAVDPLNAREASDDF
ncbi:hypothetical protein EVAR_81105_1 [Eumeta japonica]|uniref:Uncharacterized protein n=1 Tax=Eumeta variegata TaxID=151549 RepID=A0A4C1T605_EUMVA|nr:hypothetical protein EVAR_81105_1 [Eumeta japonica]